MSDIVTSGKALYWGTSEWSAEEIVAAIEIAERHNLHKPVIEQPQYNLLERQRVEVEYARVIADYGIGLTTWSPLASGAAHGQVPRRDPSRIPWAPFPATDGSGPGGGPAQQARRSEP